MMPGKSRRSISPAGDLLDDGGGDAVFGRGGEQPEASRSVLAKP